VCHSGDFRLAKFLREELNVSDSLLAGKAPEDMNAVTCAVCHDPHRRTGNAKNPLPGRDFQLRYPEVSADLAQSNVVAETTDPARFGLCAQCHHDRGRTWTEIAREPHPSVQGNFYRGEMPTPDGTASVLPNKNSVHRFVEKQCATCHMQHIRHEDVGIVDRPHVGHGFAISSLAGCVTSLCHPSEESVQNDKNNLQAFIEDRIASFEARLGDPAAWEYTAQGGPDAAGQAAVSDTVKKVRFLIHYIEADGSGGVHNPEYARDIIQTADVLLTGIGK
jgi:formate-dependent nitrite reductase cytochrome c552 subunit